MGKCTKCHNNIRSWYTPDKTKCHNNIRSWYTPDKTVPNNNCSVVKMWKTFTANQYFTQTSTCNTAEKHHRQHFKTVIGALPPTDFLNSHTGNWHKIAPAKSIVPWWKSQRWKCQNTISKHLLRTRFLSQCE